MKLIGTTLHFKSIPSFYFKELSGIKTNTVRRTDFYLPNEPANKLNIAIHNSVSGYYFVRKLKDISYYDGRYIFSW